MSSWWRTIMPAAVSAFVAALLALPGLLVNVYDASLRAEQRRLMPELQLVPAISTGLVIGTVGLFAILMARRGWPVARERSTAYKVVFVAAHVVAHVATVVALVLVVTFTNFRLFDEEYTGVKARSAARGLTVYLYADDWGCDHPIYARTDGELALRKIGEIDGQCDREPAGRRLSFSIESGFPEAGEGRHGGHASPKVLLLDSDGRELGSVPLPP